MEPHFNPYHEIQSEAPTLYALAGKHGFRIPEGYFDQLPADIQAHVALDAAGAHAGFAVPEGYFDALPGAIEARIALESHEPSDTVPEGFFAQLEQDILAQTVHASPSEQTTAHVVRFRPWMGWTAGVAAALIAIVLVFAQSTPEECETFACLWEQTDTQNVLESLGEEDLLFLLDGETTLIDDPEADEIEAYLLDDDAYDDRLDDEDLDGLLDALNDELLRSN